MFRKNKFYSVERMDDQLYLLPFGQAVAELKRGFMINETSLFLWEKLEEVHDKEELIDSLVKEYEIERNDAKDDVDAFIDQLLIYQAISVDDEETDKPCMVLDIANTRIGLYGDPAYFYHEELKDFETDSDHQDICFRVKTAFPDFVSATVIVRNSEMIVEENKEMYILHYPKEKNIREVRIARNGLEAVAYVCGVDSDEKLKEIADCLHNTLRTFFLYYVSEKGYYAIHSASILYKNKAWLFSGISGTGKSTHTQLWKKLYDVKQLNGDINLLTIEEGKVLVHGTPWCGTSGIYTNMTYEAGGIIFLVQDDDDHIEDLDQANKSLFITQRIITPCWNQEMLEKNIAFSGRIKNDILICRLHCTMKASAVDVIKQRIDES